MVRMVRTTPCFSQRRPEVNARAATHSGRLSRLSRRLARRGLLAIIAVRMVPVAPFTVVNLAAGASHIRFRDFAIGTGLGLLPGILAITIFSDRVLATVREPSPLTVLTLTAVVAAIVAGAWLLGRWLKGRLNRDESSRAGRSQTTP